MEVSEQYFNNVIINYNGDLSVDHSFLYDPPATMYWDFSMPEELQFVGKKYKVKNKMQYFIRDDLYNEFKTRCT